MKLEVLRFIAISYKLVNQNETDLNRTYIHERIITTVSHRLCS